MSTSTSSATTLVVLSSSNVRSNAVASPDSPMGRVVDDDEEWNKVRAEIAKKLQG